MFQPAIKWSGSKRSQAKEIVDLFPRDIDTYYEPFCGGCSVMRQLLEEIKSGHITCKRIVCSDLNEHLIALWQLIKNNPYDVTSAYTAHWFNLNNNPDKATKRRYFEEVRRNFNIYHNAVDFMFIMRTTTNGMPRYNQKGEFNNSFHITRDGIQPTKLSTIVFEWSELLNHFNVEFKCAPYDIVLTEANSNDFIYLDPPYANTKGMYFGNFDNVRLFKLLETLPSPWMMSYDGISGTVDNTYAVPEHLYDEHKYLRSGNSSFKRTIGKSRDSVVYESLYIKH